MMMDCRCDVKRMNGEEGDGLSSLPDDLIHKILSSFSIKHVVQTSVLSSRWRFLWTSTPHLNFFSEDFSSMHKFILAVTCVLFRRVNNTEVTSLKLSLHERVSQTFAKGILNYAFSHNVQYLTITCLIEKKIELPLSLFRSPSLKHLTLIGSTIDHSTSTWELPALTTLHLVHVTLYDDDDEDEDDDYEDDDILSNCGNLKNLALDGCKIKRLGGFCICHPQLSDLTLRNGYWGWDCVYVVAPKLKNLTIVNCDRVDLYAPYLTSLKYAANYSLVLYPACFPLLEEVDLCIRNPRKIEADVIVDLLQRLRSVKFLTLNLEIIEILSESLELISSKSSPYANLSSLTIYPVNLELEGQSQMKVAISSEVLSYLLDRSPSASFTMVTREEVKARNGTLAQHLMAELWVMLEQDKANMNWDHMERPVLSEVEEDPTLQRQREKTKIRDIVSKLQHIEGLLQNLPTSEGAILQSSFSSLRVEANFFIAKIDSMKHKEAV